MTNSAKTSKKHLTISDLYPNLTPAQQQDAEYFLRRYIDLIKRIYSRQKNNRASRLKQREI
jgi:trans-aconitate methyltransferase